MGGEHFLSENTNGTNRVFYISLNKGYFGKAIFSLWFSARYHILKKKKKKRYWADVAVVLIITLSILATCLVSSNCSVTHVRWGRALPQCCFNDGPHFQRSGDVETVLFEWITLITFGILDQTSPNFQGSRRNGCEWLRIDWDINEKRSSDIVKTSAQCFALITFEVLNQTPPNLLGSCRSSSRWCLQN